MMGGKLALQVLIHICLPIVFGSLVLSFLFPDSDSAVITPHDPLVFIGETLTMQCQLTSSAKNVASSDMYFTIYFRDYDLTWTVPEEDTTVINSTTITANITITNNFSEYTSVTCRTRDQEQLCSVGVHAERPIRNITNFTALFFYDNSTIVSTWSLGETYLDPGEIEVTVDWNPYSSPNMSGNVCKVNTTEFCSFEVNSQDVFFIRINVSTVGTYKRPGEEYLVPMYDTQAISLHRFALKDNMKIGPPKALNVNKNSTCVNITWQDSPYYNTDGSTNSIYRLEIKKEDEPEFQVAVDSAEKLDPTKIVQLCQLVPYTKYTLSVQIKVRDVYPWSDRTTVEFTTLEDFPVTGPPVTDTSYLVEECVKNTRKVFVYWKDPSISDLRGILTKFEVVRGNSSVPLRSGTNVYVDSIECDTTYDILVYTVNNVGLSLTPSRINIPKKSKELTLENDLMFKVEDRTSSLEKSSLNVSITWNPGNHVENISLILYMCMGTNIPNTCFNDFTTKEISLDKKEIILNDLDSSINMFGYALTDGNNRKQGIQWTNCIYRADIKPDKPTGLTVSPGSQANSLLIAWTSSQCSKITKVLIIRYHLFVCPQVVEEELMNRTCTYIVIDDMRRNNDTVTDLKGGHTYHVYIQAESPTLPGFISDPVQGTPKEPGTDIGVYIGAAIGALTAAIGMALLIFCLARCCIISKKRIKASREASTNVLTFLNNDQRTVRQASEESGVYTASNPDSNKEENCAIPATPPRLPNDVASPQNSYSESNTVRSDLVLEEASLGALKVDINGISTADGVDSHSSSKNANTSDSGSPYMFLRDALLLNERPDIGPLSDTQENRAGNVGFNSSSIVNTCSTNLELTECPHPQSMTNLPPPVTFTLTSPVQSVYFVEHDTRSSLESPPTPFSTDSNIDQTQSLDKNMTLTAGFHEAARCRHPVMSDVLQKQISSRVKDIGRNSGLNEQQCLDPVRCSPDGRIGPHNLQDDRGALTVSSDHENDEHTVLSDNGYTRQTYMSNSEVSDNNSDQSTEIIDQVLGQTSIRMESLGSIEHSECNDFNMHGPTEEINWNEGSLGNAEFQMKREFQTQVTQEGSDSHLHSDYRNNTNSNNQTNMEVSGTTNSGNQSSGDGYVSHDCLMEEDTVDPYVTQSHGYIRQIPEDMQYDESLDDSFENTQL